MKLYSHLFILFSSLFLYSQNSFAQNQIDSLQKEIKNTVSDSGKINLYNELALHYLDTDLDSALAYAEKSFVLAQNQKNYKCIFDAQNSKGIIYHEKGDADQAMAFFLEAIATQEKHLPRQSLAKLYKHISMVFYNQKEYQEAERYLEKALKEAQNKDKTQEKGGLYEVYFGFATLYSRLKDFEKSTFYFDKCLEQPIISQLDKASVYLNKGNMYQRKKSLDSAEIAYQKALKIIDESKEKDDKTLGKIYNSLTDVALKTGRYDLAEEYGNKGLEYANKTQNLRSAIYAFRNLGYAYYLREDYKSAFEVQAKARKLRDSLNQMTNTRVLNELEQKYQNEKKQNEIEKLKQEQILYTEREQATKTRNILFLIIAIITTMVLLLILQLQRIRHKRDIAIKEREKENQKQIQLLELREKELQIEQYKEQLHRHTHNLLQKNLVLSELREELNSLKEFEDEEQKYKKQKIEELINSRILTEEDWQNYKQTFSNVYPQFFQQLTTRFPKVSKAEKRIATLLKLGLSQYEMATILGISEESARKGKYRLRQRLEVESEEELIQLLNEIS